MNISFEQRRAWKAALDSANVVDVLNAMTAIRDFGDLSAATLLQQAGRNIPPLARRMTIKTPDGSTTFEGLREHCLSVLSGGKQMTSGHARKLFISYNHQDEADATRLALKLQQEPNIDVFIDHWNMSAGEPLLDRIEKAIDESSFLIVLLSTHSAQSQWVRTELRYAYSREQEDKRTFILPILLDDCKIPIHVVGRIYVDMRPQADQERGYQYVLNAIRGAQPFSKIVADFLRSPTFSSPYDNKAIREGRQILVDLAQHREMDVEENQKWVLWELFHRLLPQYKCTLKIGESYYANVAADSVQFTLIDRWNEKHCHAVLTKEDLQRGLWETEFDLLRGCELHSTDMNPLASSRFSFQSKCNPATSVNPFLNSCGETMSPVLAKLDKSMVRFEAGSQQSFLFDLQSLVFGPAGHKVRVVVGNGSDDLCRAFSPIHTIKCSEASPQWGIFEIYDPFFVSLKYTSVCPAHLSVMFEGDLDLMDGSSEVLLGPS